MQLANNPKKNPPVFDCQTNFHSPIKLITLLLVSLWNKLFNGIKYVSTATKSKTAENVHSNWWNNVINIVFFFIHYFCSSTTSSSVSGGASLPSYFLYKCFKEPQLCEKEPNIKFIINAIHELTLFTWVVRLGCTNPKADSDCELNGRDRMFWTGLLIVWTAWRLSIWIAGLRCLTWLVAVGAIDGSAFGGSICYENLRWKICAQNRSIQCHEEGRVCVRSLKVRLICSCT